MAIAIRIGASWVCSSSTTGCRMRTTPLYEIGYSQRGKAPDMAGADE